TLTWTGDLAVGASATIAYTVTVRDPDPGNAVLSNTVVSPTRGSNCPAGNADPRCAASVPVARLLLELSYTQAGATPGSTITLNGTFTNTGQVPYSGISVSSSNAGAFDDAIPNGDQVASSGTIVLDATDVTWTGNIPVGGVVTLTGTLTLKNPPTGDLVVTGTMVSAAPGNNCPSGGTDPRCTARLDVLVPGLTITKTADASVAVQAGTVGYTVTVVNSGQAPYTGATFTDPLAGVLDDAVYNADATATSGAVGFAGSTLTWTGDLAVGASATIAYTVTVRDPDPGDKRLVNTISSPTAGGNCAPANGDPRCTVTVTVLVPALTITSTAAPTTAVPGSTIIHTITATNTGPLPYTGATFTDALAGLLDDASYNTDASATTGTVGLSGSVLTWTGDLAPGAGTTVTFTVTVDNPVTGDLNLVTTITSATPGTNCPPGGTDSRCDTGVSITQATDLTFDKGVSTVSVAEGEVVTYTVTISNSGLAPYVGASFTDSLAGTLDDAAYNDDAEAETGVVTYTAPDLTWSGNVPAAGSTTVVYSVTANSPGTGNGILSNTLVSDSVGGNCAATSTDPRCAKTVTLAALDIVLTAGAPTALPGGVVRYTTVITNTGQTAYDEASVLFEVPDIVDDSTPNGDQTATSGSLSLTPTGLIWTGNVPVGGSVTITGSSTVNNPDLGDGTLTLTAISTAQGNSCPLTTAPGCSAVVTVLTPGLTITKIADRTAVVPGEEVAYTVTITNSGESVYTGAVVTDDMTGVLNEASYNADATATTGAVGFAGSTLTWTGDLAVGASATVTYSVTAGDASTGGKLLTDTVASTEMGSTCPPASGDVACIARVVILTPVLTITKTADKASTTPGGTVTYTIKATNTGQVPFEEANLTDALAGVLDDAAYNADADATLGTVAFGGQAITWSGALAPGQAAVITYSVTADTPGTGDRRLSNAVTSTTAGATCPVGAVDPRCSGEVLISRITITNSADVATAVPAGTVNYTTTIANTGRTPYSGVVVDDLLAGVLDDATYDNNGTATAGDFTIAPGSDRGEWRGALAVGDVVTVTFSVTVMNPDPGDKVLTAVATSATPGTNCPAGSTDPACTSTVTVLTPVLDVSKSADRTTVTPGGVITYTITATNGGETPYIGATVTDRLDAVLPDSVYNGDAAATSGTVVFAGTDVIWTGDLTIGASVTITYSVTVRSPDPGDKLIFNRVFSDTPGSTCPSAGSVPACTTLITVLVPALTIVNTADTVTTTPGGTVGYTITITNTGQTDYIGATVTDALAGTLDDAAYNADATATTGTVGLTGSTLTWTGDLAVGASAVVGYSVTVDTPDNGDKALRAVVTSSEPGSTCPVGGADPACASTVTVLIPGLAISTVADRATATPGDVVRFTITIANTGQTAYDSVSVTDALAGVLDDATYGGNATAGTGTLVFDSPTLTWTGALAVGATAIVTFSVVTGDPSAGDKIMTSVVASAAPGSTCPADSVTPACRASVTVLVPALDIVKTADAPTTTPGDTIGYTIVVANAGETSYDAASVTDSLTAVLDAADYNEDAVATTGVLGYAGETLTWTGALAVGASATITYSITVHEADDVGDKLLSNTAVSGSQGSSCPVVGAAAACTAFVRVLVPELTITKSADAGTVVAGGTVAYTITAVNTGETDYLGATVVDRMTEVLDDAAYNDDANATVGTVAYTEPELTWTGDLVVGAGVTITYSVDVAYPAPGDRILRNSATSTVPGSTCPMDGGDPNCVMTVIVLIPELTVTKTADTVGVVAGGTVRYTITATNTGEAPYTGAMFADSLAGVLDDASYDGDAVATVGTVTYAEPTLTWAGDLPVGASAVVTFSVTVLREDTGDAVLDNRVTSTTTGNTCPVGSADPGCFLVIAVTPTSITLEGLTSEFTMAGRPNSTVRNDGAVSMTVITNNFYGYTVTVGTDSAELTSNEPGNTVTIPVGNLRVRESGTFVFRDISPTTSLLVHEQDVPSAPTGDAIVTDFEADIPFVPVGTYSVTLTYVATAK
ncbi:beta strand repeat-containing protein, partial [Streptosporangium sp. DT93]|uniref:beta strand repeat-containing protein n=1 Tax=Streptosporangium sp. DT93 TaxID=3393428 RepID=UPI003CE8F2E5